MKPLVSVIITTKNEASVIGELLTSLAGQTHKHFEIIVVDNHSTDDTRTVVRSFGARVFTKGPERSAQRNFGAGRAAGNYLLFLDADMVLEDGVISECMKEAKKNPDANVVVIPEKSVGVGYWAKCKALERACYVGDETIEAARFFDKQAFWEMGGYDEQLTGPEDWDLPQRIRRKYAIARIQSYILHNERNVTLLSLARKKYYYGRKVSRYIARHPISVTGQQLIYLLRPAFYRNWRRLLSHPILTIGMMVMLVVEQTAGFLGFLAGRFFP